MTWWQIGALVIVLTVSHGFMALLGSSIATSTHTARDIAEQAKWQVPDAIQGHE